jgi:hypothetical protein
MVHFSIGIYKKEKRRVAWKRLPFRLPFYHPFPAKIRSSKNKKAPSREEAAIREKNQSHEKVKVAKSKLFIPIKNLNHQKSRYLAVEGGFEPPRGS